MKFILTIAIIIIHTFCAEAQDMLHVEYVSTLNSNVTDEQIIKSLPKDIPTTVLPQIILSAKKETLYNLFCTKSASLYKLSSLSSDIQKIKTNGITVKAGTDDRVMYYFDFIKKDLVATMLSGMGPVLVKQKKHTLPAFPCGNQATILGFTCIEVEVTYCDEVYDVLYTPEIPIPSGPKVFTGFPGLVLKVTKKGSSRSLMATQINWEYNCELTDCEVNLEKVTTGFELSSASSLIDYCQMR